MSRQEVEYFRHLSKELAAEPALHFVLRRNELNVDDVAFSSIVKKCLLYSSRTIVLDERARYVIPVGNVKPTSSAAWRMKPASVLEEFGISTAGFPDAGMLLVEMPEYIEEERENWDGDEFSCDGIKTVFTFPETYTKQDSIEVLLKDPLLHAQFKEVLNELHLRVINIWLPSLSCISITDLIKLRLDEQDAFSNMHMALRRFAAKLPETDSDTKLKELMQEVDYHVRSLDRRFHELKRRYNISLGESVIGASIAGLCLAIPVEIGKIVSAFIGSYQTKEFVRSLFRHREELHDLRASDFYGAWEIQRVGQALRPHTGFKRR